MLLISPRVRRLVRVKRYIERVESDNGQNEDRKEEGENRKHRATSTKDNLEQSRHSCWFSKELYF